MGKERLVGAVLNTEDGANTVSQRHQQSGSGRWGTRGGAGACSGIHTTGLDWVRHHPRDCKRSLEPGVGAMLCC